MSNRFQESDIYGCLGHSRGRWRYVLSEPKKENEPQKVSRRSYLQTTGGVIAGLVIGGALGYLAKPAGTATTVTATETAMETVTVTGSAPPVTTTAAAQAGAIDYWCISGPQYDLAVHASKGFMSANPNVTVTVDQSSETEFTTGLNTRYSSAPPPDMGFFYAGPTYVPGLADAGLLMELDGVYTKYGWDKALSPGYKDYAYKGHLYVITHDYVGYPYIYYNPKIFQQLGLTAPPAKLDDLYSIVDKVKSSGYLGISWGLATAPPWAANQFTFAVSNLLTGEEFSDFSNNYGLGLTTSSFAGRKVKFNDPSMVKAWQLMGDWGKRLYVDGFTGAGDSDAISLFAQGKAAMYQTGSWGPALLDPVVKDFDYDMFNIPTDFGTNPGHMGSVANCLAISAKTHSPDVCTGFADFMLSEGEQAWMSSVAGGFPSRMGIPTSEITNPKMGKGYQLFGSFTPSLVFGVSLSPKIVSELVATLQSVLNQSTAPKDAADHMEDYSVKASGSS